MAGAIAVRDAEAFSETIMPAASLVCASRLLDLKRLSRPVPSERDSNASNWLLYWRLKAKFAFALISGLA